MPKCSESRGGPYGGGHTRADPLKRSRVLSGGQRGRQDIPERTLNTKPRDLTQRVWENEKCFSKNRGLGKII